MIIFDLDGTLADCEHRRHFVDATKDPNCFINIYYSEGDLHREYIDTRTKECWKPDWQAFFEACDQDVPIVAGVDAFNRFSYDVYNFPNFEIQIWSGRSESVRKKTEKWLYYHLYQGGYFDLKMRPDGNTEPDEVLKERWLDEAIADGKKIEFVFDAHPASIAMWRRRGIFVFNCCQHDEEF